ncbi:hypothetical protein DQ04_00661110 [Trypanosoma grayi]|uniref:hypothetical protein n=1 Tax=Trypanosoma grayi TaxID=71804 RepID=UPI0004F3F740|nr:hypothetical protein DQ04_00661110 [Trypanosoma grayi]KEG14033.1 hypothetical protein DQ04_00661110 [Trypanosoma grayi]
MNATEYINNATMALSKSFLGEMLTSASALMEARKDPHLRCAVLDVLRTIVSQCDDPKSVLQPFANDIVAIVKLTMKTQEEAAVRKCVVEYILAICTSKADFSLAAGYSDILSCLITCASFSERCSDSLAEVRDASRNALMLLASSRGTLVRQLWPSSLSICGNTL